jgi:hypothetical protein
MPNIHMNGRIYPITDRKAFDLYIIELARNGPIENAERLIQ